MTREVDVKALISHLVRGDGTDKCRICMGDTTEGQVYLGDTVMMDGERPVTLAELLEVITGVEIEEEKFCPKGACIACTAAAMAAQEFRVFVRNSQRMWNKAINVLSEIPKNRSGPSGSSVQSLCTFIKPDNFQSHTVKDYMGGDSRTMLKRLKLRLTKKDQPAQKRTRTVRAGPMCSCPDCGKSFYGPYYLKIHLRNSGVKDACSHCGVVLIKGREMMDHLLKSHGEASVLCKQCPLLFPNSMLLKKHVNKAHKSNSYTCSDCGRNFPSKLSFEVHSQMHTVWTCRACGMQFTNRGCYREHRLKCDPNACPDLKSLPRNKRSNVRYPSTFTCDYCGKSYLSRPQLKNHIVWIHMDVRPHQCQWCGKRFYTPARLAEHTVVHTRERNFECDICGVKLVSKMAAVYHRRRHTGERPYKCDDCDESFISASRRSQHAKRRHGKGPMIQCVECPANFVKGIELKKHMEKVHKTQGQNTVKG